MNLYTTHTERKESDLRCHVLSADAMADVQSRQWVQGAAGEATRFMLQFLVRGGALDVVVVSTETAQNDKASGW